mgnify:CR=1 FL=1
MKIIWKYLKPFKGLLFLAMGLVAIAQILELIDPIIVGKIIEEGTHYTLLDKKGLYYAMWRQQIGERKTVPV